MLFLAWLLFILPLLGLIHTYMVYPVLMRSLARKKPPFSDFFAEASPELPHVSILSSLFNEEKVIGEKLTSLAELRYPQEKLSIYIASDQSTDRTDEIVSDFAEQHAQVYFFPFRKRRGKPPVINELVEKAIQDHGKGKHHVLIITDANVLLSPEVVYRLARHFTREEVALVDAHMRHTGMQSEGISKVEDQYISGEVYLKHWEGKAWGKMIGPFGGCYAVRSDYFHSVPENFLVDDFYIAMRALEQGGSAINDLEANCYEAVSHTISNEYRRKKRISAGNFQNLSTFRHLCWPLTDQLAFAFVSHKVLRWLGPFFMLSMLWGTLLLMMAGNFLGKWLLLILSIGWFILPALDFLAGKLGIHVFLLRGLRYFMLMNVALLAGFFKFLKGIKSNVWQPTQRN